MWVTNEAVLIRLDLYEFATLAAYCSQYFDGWLLMILLLGPSSPTWSWYPSTAQVLGAPEYLILSRIMPRRRNISYTSITNCTDVHIPDAYDNIVMRCFRNCTPCRRLPSVRSLGRLYSIYTPKVFRDIPESNEILLSYALTKYLYFKVRDRAYVLV